MSASELARKETEQMLKDAGFEGPDAKSVIRGLMEIAELAMPSTYFQTDSRVVAARQWLEKNNG